MKFDIYDRRQYFDRVAADVAAAGQGSRVVVAAMTFDSREPQIQKLLAELQAAAARGARVCFIIDAFTFLIGEHKLPGPLWYHGSLHGRLRHPYRGHLEALHRLEQAGVQTVITNKPARRLLPPHKGRSHIKAAVIDDKYYIGGCNLTSAKQLDIMAALYDTAGADWLYSNLILQANAGSSQAGYHGIDSTLRISKSSDLILDSGKPKQSAILSRAYQLIDEAEQSITLTCQFFPGSGTAQRLLAAHRRGVQVRIYFSHPSVHSLESPIHHLYVQHERSRLPKEFFGHMLPKGMPKMHAKVLLSEKAAMLGSHNYVPQGVSLGTAELALYTEEHDFIRDLEQQVMLLVGGRNHALV